MNKNPNSANNDIYKLSMSLDKLSTALEKKNSLDEKKLMLEHKKFIFEQHKFKSKGVSAITEDQPLKIDDSTEEN